MRLNDNEELVMTNVNQARFEELEPQDKFHRLEQCANENTNTDTPFSKAWDRCSSIPEFKGVDAVRHGANPNLRGSKRWQRLEFTESAEYWQFSKCFKGIRSKIGKGDAWRKCDKKYNVSDKLNMGEVHKESIPKHDLYRLTEEAYSINKTIDSMESPLRDNKQGTKIYNGIYKDPTRQSKLSNAKEWAGLMGAGTIISHAPGIISSGGASIPTAAGLAALNAAKGAAVGPLLTGGKDTLLKSVVIPTAVVASTTLGINELGDDLGYGEEVDQLPETRAGVVAGLGMGIWALRNRKNKDRIYY